MLKSVCYYRAPMRSTIRIARFAPGIVTAAALLAATALNAQNSSCSAWAPTRMRAAPRSRTYDPASKRLFVVSPAGVDVLSLADPSSPTLVATWTETGFSANSVAARGGLVAVADQAEPKTSSGHVYFYDADGNTHSNT